MPVIEDIAELIKARIEAGTYTPAYKPQRVVRPNKLQTNKQWAHLECLLIQMEGGRNPDYDIHGNPNAIGWTQDYWIFVGLSPSDLDENPIDKWANHVSSELVKAITTGSGGIDWSQWNNKAKTSTYDFGVGVDAKTGQIVAAIVTVTVHMAFSETDPDTAR